MKCQQIVMSKAVVMKHVHSTNDMDHKMLYISQQLRPHQILHIISG